MRRRPAPPAAAPRARAARCAARHRAAPANAATQHGNRIHRGARRARAQSRRHRSVGKFREICVRSPLSRLPPRSPRCPPRPLLRSASRRRPSSGIERLERQVHEMQRQVFPKGRPADTAGFSDDPAATQSSVDDARPAARRARAADDRHAPPDRGERQPPAQPRSRTSASSSTDQEQRIAALEQRMNEAAATAAPAQRPPTASCRHGQRQADAGRRPHAAQEDRRRSGRTPAMRPAAAAGRRSTPARTPTAQGFHLWEAGNYDQAISTLRAFISAYPKHRARQLRQQPHRPRACSTRATPAPRPGAACQLPQQPGRRARARQPFTSARR